ncbi:T3.4 [Pyrus ussuriensis x Pyrus communis]|uniref:T3.4 n=1 Tax=Pyrus ussuriensis x Pyrus communis TaxID=2448454 RepID=A0A5N5HH24_9ROSA|nr:T3.4 [Pyrus ussuriensis x Pyrus communis]
MGDPLGSSRVRSQKQNRESVVGAQNEQYCATVKSSPGCGGGLGCDVTLSSTQNTTW